MYLLHGYWKVATITAFDRSLNFTINGRYRPAASGRPAAVCCTVRFSPSFTSISDSCLQNGFKLAAIARQKETRAATEYIVDVDHIIAQKTKFFSPAWSSENNTFLCAWNL